MDLGGMVRAARRAVGLTQDEAAKRAGVSPRALWTLESGSGSITTFHKVATVVDFRITGLPQGKTLGRRLKAARVKRGRSQASVATQAGVSVPTVRSLENDGGNITSLRAVLKILAPAARARKPETAAWESGKRDVRLTPKWLLDDIREFFGPISTDPCAAENSFTDAAREIFEAEDGLETRWEGPFAFANPPFSAAAVWLERCFQAWATGEVQTVMALVPTRTNTRVFHERCAGVADVLFMKGRPNFVNPFQPDVSGQTPFGVNLIVWGANSGAAQGLAAKLGARLMERDKIAA